MRSQRVRTGSDGKAEILLSRSLTSTTHCQSTRFCRLPPWLAQSYASVSTSAKPSQLEKYNHSSVERFTPQKQRALARSSVFTQTSLEQELRYLKDPRKLADYIDSLLQRDQYGKAYELVKKSCRDVPCTVSWNHLINFAMSAGKLANACALYNDMKKRAQKPDAQTYTIMFRGLAMFPDYPQSLARALSIYESMYADNCPVKPSIIHINAVLKVCARSHDTDALFGVAAKLPTHGPGAADNLTFTTILNAIRADAWRAIDNDTLGGKDQRRHRASMQGRRIWGEVISRWKKGDIKIDEELVCSMGRLLLLADSERSCRDVLSLVAQTMGIEQPQSLAQTSSRAVDAPEDVSTGSDHQVARSPSPNEPELDPHEPPDDAPGSEFNPISGGGFRRSPFPQAGCNTLSMIIDACTRLRAIPAAQNYWSLLTDPNGPHNITPDSENYHMFLRLLRIQRASRLALEIVRDMRRGPAGSKPIKLEPKTFRIALSACRRDIANPNVLEIAGALARMMLDTLPIPDIKSLELYLDVAMSQKTSSDSVTLMSVLRGGVLGVRNLRAQMIFDGNREDPTPGYKDDLMRLMRSLISAFDVTVAKSGGHLSQKELRDCEEQKRTLMSWVTRANRSERPSNLVAGVKNRSSMGVLPSATELRVRSKIPRSKIPPRLGPGSKPLGRPLQQGGFDQDTQLIPEQQRLADEPRERDGQNMKFARWQTQIRTPTKGGARGRMKRMAKLDEEYAEH
ncbi:hypothetical protein MMC07_002785 [Pseudocyphellaria aurata]|nr:hypothetical protein [Pseudocyphellaria aurata]